MPIWSILFAVLLLAPQTAVPSSSANPAITQEELVRRTQELFDSVAIGNQKPWKDYFAEDAMYFDEKGRAMDKAALVADVTPLPTGYSGTIKLISAKSRILGQTAILSYDLDETETVYGQNMTARYHGTDTWMLRNGQWQIRGRPDASLLRRSRSRQSRRQQTHRLRRNLSTRTRDHQNCHCCGE